MCLTGECRMLMKSIHTIHRNGCLPPVNGYLLFDAFGRLTGEP